LIGKLFNLTKNYSSDFGNEKIISLLSPVQLEIENFLRKKNAVEKFAGKISQKINKIRICKFSLPDFLKIEIEKISQKIAAEILAENCDEKIAKILENLGIIFKKFCENEEFSPENLEMKNEIDPKKRKIKHLISSILELVARNFPENKILQKK